MTSHPLSAKWQEEDDYKRSPAICFDGETNINQAMVKSGFALPFRRYSTIYVSDEEEVKRQNIGVWQGQFTEPWGYSSGDKAQSILKEQFLAAF